MLRRLPLFFAAALFLASCRTTGRIVKGTVKTTAKVAYGTAKLGGKVAYGTVKVAGGLVKDMAYYAARKAFYEKNHDSGDFDSGGAGHVIGRRYPKLPAYKGEWRWPLGAGIVSSEFGSRWHRRHQGVDIAADEGEPVYASAAGKVLYADNRMRGFGNVVIVRHDSQMVTLYAHNQSMKVRRGDMVEQGQIIALLGSTGHSTGPHVHFEMRRDSEALNPRKLLPKSGF